MGVRVAGLVVEEEVVEVGEMMIRPRRMIGLRRVRRTIRMDRISVVLVLADRKVGVLGSGPAR